MQEPDGALLRLVIEIRPAGVSMDTSNTDLSRRWASCSVCRCVPPKQRSSIRKRTCILDIAQVSPFPAAGKHAGRFPCRLGAACGT